MKNETESEKDNQAGEQIVMADECGDSMWDAVLGQEIKACEIDNGNSTLKALLQRIENVQECDATEAK